ncbi:hypothetical protein M0802_001777 [Mischocyttarus mexicanus]|nr:hypothetical protein M0802_001777 [Mischocyttarus mexicanus]
MGEGNVTLKLVSAYLQVSPYLRKTQSWAPRSLVKLAWRRTQCSEARKQQWQHVKCPVYSPAFYVLTKEPLQDARIFENIGANTPQITTTSTPANVDTCLTNALAPLQR